MYMFKLFNQHPIISQMKTHLIVFLEVFAWSSFFYNILYIKKLFSTTI